MKQLIALLLLIAVASAGAASYTKSTGPLCHYTSLSATDCAETITYEIYDSTYEKTYTFIVPLYVDWPSNTKHISAYLANSKGYIGDSTSATNPSFKKTPTTQITDVLFGKYTPVFEDDVFFVNDVPIQVSNIMPMASGFVQVELNAPFVHDTAAQDGISQSIIKVPSSACAVFNINWYKCTVSIPSSSPALSSTVTLIVPSALAYNPAGNSHEFVLVDSGADDAVNTLPQGLPAETITWVNAWDNLQYTDVSYEKSFDLQLQNGVKQEAFLAADENGLIGDPASKAAFGKGANVNTWNMGKYLPLYVDDVFFVLNRPVSVDTVYPSNAKNTAYVIFTLDYTDTGDSSFEKKVFASDGACSDGDVAKSWVACKGVATGIGGQTIDFYFPWDSAQYTGDEFVVIDRGADNDVNTKDVIMTWAQGTGVTRSSPNSIIDMYGGPTPREISLVAQDAASPKIDNFKPAIGGNAATPISVGGKTVTFTWTTDKASNSAVKCSPADRTADKTSSSLDLVTKHSLTVSMTNGVWSCTATSADEVGNRVTSVAPPFTVSGVPQTSGSQAMTSRAKQGTPKTPTTPVKMSPFRARFQSDSDYNAALFVGGIAVAAALLLVGYVWSRQQDVTEAFGKLFAKKKRKGL